MKTTTLELEEEDRFRNSEDPEAPPETSVKESDPMGEGRDEQEIQQRAYEYWLERGCPEGSAEEDWFRAERELRERGG